MALTSRNQHVLAAASCDLRFKIEASFLSKVGKGSDTTTAGGPPLRVHAVLLNEWK